MIDDVLHNNRIVICTGTGGVGKTTTSAALGIRSAVLGKKAIVLTIDPAKRLADSLGIGDITNKPARVDLPGDVKGELWATMLDVKDTMDGIIREFAPSERQAEEILKNPIYQQFSQELGGGQEYGAMGRLYQMDKSREYDIIILDTPPSQHAIDFINAPRQLADFFSQSVLKYFLPGSEKSIVGATSQFVAKGSVMILKVLQKLTGSRFVEDMRKFFVNFQGMYETFREQSERVTALLKDNDTSFMIILGPEMSQVAEALTLFRELTTMEIYFGGYIINKCSPVFFRPDNVPESQNQEVNDLIRFYRWQLLYEESISSALLDGLPQDAFIQKVEVLHRDVHSVELLTHISSRLGE